MFLNQNFGRRPTLWLGALLVAAACTAGVESIAPAHPSGPTFLTAQPVSTAGLVISQVYGGGGNNGATLKNDFIELYNGSSSPISLAGFSVQYASATGTSWQITNLSGTLQSGHYYLVQEAQGSGGTTNLPTADATGTIPMSATAGKVALVNSTTAVSGTGCPLSGSPSVIDYVGFGNTTGSTANCFEGSASVPTLSNTTAAFRADGGRTDTNNNGADFSVAAPSPRNSASTPLPPLNALTVTISPSTPAVLAGATVNFTASASQGGQPVAVTSSAWTTSNPAVATIDAATGVASALTVGTSTIGVTVTTASGNASSSTLMTVSGAAANVTVAPTTWTLRSGQTKQFTASATDGSGNAVSTTYTWTTASPAIATIDASTGVATGHGVGSTTLTATAPNGVAGTATISVTAGNVSVQGRADPLPVGFQTQLFVNSGSTDNSGNAVNAANVTWSSASPGVVAVDPGTGVITARSAGTAVISATANSDGISSGSATITTDVEAVSPTARVGHNTELGTPTDADPSDDVIIARRNYTLSYNVSHGGPNWVSWNLDASHKGSASRCNCFTADTALTRMGIHAFDTNEWINMGIYSRGHMSPSADWADTPGDNAPTFFLSNMIPQNQTANAGAWGDLENYLRTLATGNTEIYIIAGPVFTRNRSGAGIDGFGFLTGTGHIAVPDSMWKVAIVVPDGRSANGITSPSDVQVIAVNMPNEASSSGTYNRFTTTIDKIQRSTGYDFLSALPESVQCRLESRNCAPVASVAAVTGATEGSPVTLDASGSTDADGDALSYSWTFGDGSTGTGVSPSHTYVDNGQYGATVTVTDGHGGSSMYTQNVVVANVPPVPTLSPASTTLRAGTVFNPVAAFSDAGIRDATWKAVVAWGDGTTLSASITTQSSAPIRASKVYATPGSYVVRFTVTDKDNGSAFVERTITVTP